MLFLVIICSLTANLHSSVLRFFPNATALGNDYYDTWMGTIYAGYDNCDWIYHCEHGWLCLIGENKDSAWVWDDDMQCYWWSADGFYPYIANEDGWFYYYENSNNPRRFWNYNTASINFDLFFSIPDYIPNYWNDSFSICVRNNCYNYACNKVTNTFAQPGLYSGIVISSHSQVTAQYISSPLKKSVRMCSLLDVSSAV